MNAKLKKVLIEEEMIGALHQYVYFVNDNIYQFNFQIDRLINKGKVKTGVHKRFFTNPIFIEPNLLLYKQMPGIAIIPYFTGNPGKINIFITTIE